MKHSFIYIILTVLVVILVWLFLVRINSPQTLTSDTLTSGYNCPDFSQAEALVGEQTFQVGLASTGEQITRGLGGCPSIPDRHGLLFLFNEPLQASFWMKDMLTSIDIIWINEGQIVGIESNVPTPIPGQALPTYRPPAEVNRVLEIGAGQAAKYDLKVGDPVSFGLPLS